MARMGAMAVSTTGAMAGMGATAIATRRVPMRAPVLRADGLGRLTHLPHAVLQPLLVILLLVAVVAALWHARAARTWPAMALAGLIMVAAGLYASIDAVVSEGGYGVVRAVLLRASVLLPWVGRRGRLVRVR